MEGFQRWLEQRQGSSMEMEIVKRFCDVLQTILEKRTNFKVNYTSIHLVVPQEMEETVGHFIKVFPTDW